jgi:hypothetical protein
MVHVQHSTEVTQEARRGNTPEPHGLHSAARAALRGRWRLTRFGSPDNYVQTALFFPDCLEDSMMSTPNSR